MIRIWLAFEKNRNFRKSVLDSLVIVLISQSLSHELIKNLAP